LLHRVYYIKMWECFKLFRKQCKDSTNIHNHKLNKDWVHSESERRSSRSQGRPPWVVNASRQNKLSPKSPSLSPSGAKSTDSSSAYKENSIIGNVRNSADLRLIFLDIDGTINHPHDLGSSTTLLCLDCVKQLKHIIEKTSCRIVLSSSWRLNSQHKKTLFRYLRAIEIDKGVMIGETLDLSSRNQTRTDEIRDWLFSPKLYSEGDSAVQPWQIQSWVSLDDMDLKGMEAEEDLKSNHITIDPRLGLCKTEDIVTKVVQKLRKNEHDIYIQNRRQHGNVCVENGGASLSSDFNKKTVEKIDIIAWPEMIKEAKGLYDTTPTDMTFCGDVTSPVGSESEDHYTYESITPKRPKESEEQRATLLDLLQDDWEMNVEDAYSYSKTQLPFNMSTSNTASCRVVYKCGARESSVVQVERRLSTTESCPVRTSPRNVVSEMQYDAEVKKPNVLPTLSIDRHTHKLSIARANLSNLSPRSCFTNLHSDSNFGDLPAINLGSLDSLPNAFVSRSPSFRSRISLRDCASGTIVSDGDHWTETRSIIFGTG